MQSIKSQKLVAAILIFCQAVFLLLPLEAHLQEISYIPVLGLPTTTSDGKIYFHVRVNPLAQSVKLHIPDSGLGEIVMSKQSETDYYYDYYEYYWDILLVSPGTYSGIVAYALYGGVTYNSDPPMVVTVYNNTVNNTANTPVITLNEPVNNNTLSENITIKGYISPYTSTLTNVRAIVLNEVAGTASSLPMTCQSSGLCSVEWNTKTFDNGTYKIKIEANQGTIVLQSSEFTEYVNNVTVSLNQPAENSIISGTTVIRAAIAPVDSSTYLKANVYNENGTLMNYWPMTYQDGTYYANWNTSSVANGTYKIKIEANKSGTIYYSKDITVKVDNVISTIPTTTVSTTTVSTSTIPTTTVSTTTTTAIPTNKIPATTTQTTNITTTPTTTQVITPAPIPVSTIKPTTTIISTPTNITAPITSVISNNVSTITPVPITTSNTVTPTLISEQPVGGNTVATVVSIATELPIDCQQANIKTDTECKNFLLSKEVVSEECKNAGIIGTRNCDEFMMRTYNNVEQTSAKNLPTECLQAGAITPENCNAVLSKIYLPVECQNKGISELQQCQAYLEQIKIPEECRNAGIKTQQECEQYKLKKYSTECTVAGINNDEECKAYMFNLYASNLRCKNESDWLCRNNVKENFLGTVIDKQIAFNKVQEQTSDIINQSINVQDLSAKIQTQEVIVPIQNQEVKVRVISAQKELVLENEENLIQTSPVGLVLDADGDGLFDEMEKRLGTDVNNPDTDGDGYSDGDEVRDGYNPLGQGKMTQEIAPVEKAILENKALDHPKSEGELDSNLKVEEVKNVTATGTPAGYEISGKANPNSIVSIYIYSDLPLVTTVKTDEYGNWQYKLDYSLIDGEHEVYVALNDETGKVISKSNPLSFFVKEAQAASIEDVLLPIESESLSGTGSLMRYYITVTGSVVTIALISFVAILIRRRKKLQLS